LILNLKYEAKIESLGIKLYTDSLQSKFVLGVENFRSIVRATFTGTMLMDCEASVNFIRVKF